jgi:hypothetical protein
MLALVATMLLHAYWSARLSKQVSIGLQLSLMSMKGPCLVLVIE